MMDAMQSLIMMELSKNLSAGNNQYGDTSPMKGRERINSSFGHEEEQLKRADLTRKSFPPKLILIS